MVITVGQKAPSAIRCIKTAVREREARAGLRQKAPSAIRCIKTHYVTITLAVTVTESESTERHKVH